MLACLVARGHPSILVDPGFCRTESDFETAIAKRYGERAFDVLYLPEDPNGSRFGDTILRAANRLNVPGIGTTSTISQGCAEAFVWDCPAMGANAAELLRHLLRGDQVEPVCDGALRVERARNG